MCTRTKPSTVNIIGRYWKVRSYDTYVDYQLLKRMLPNKKRNNNHTYYVVYAKYCETKLKKYHIQLCDTGIAYVLIEMLCVTAYKTWNCCDYDFLSVCAFALSRSHSLIYQYIHISVYILSIYQFIHLSIHQSLSIHHCHAFWLGNFPFCGGGLFVVAAVRLLLLLLLVMFVVIFFVLHFHAHLWWVHICWGHLLFGEINFFSSSFLIILLCIVA